MKQRIDCQKVATDAYKAILAVEGYVRRSELDHTLLELVKTRVSQTNGSAHCLDMHTKDAWAEAVTQLSANDVCDAIYAKVRRHFDQKGLVDLTLVVIGINDWSRLVVSFRSEAGSDQPKAAQAA